MRKISIKFRIILLIGIAVLFALGVGVAFYGELQQTKNIAVQRTQEVMLEGQQEKLQVGTHSMAVAIGELVKNAASEEEQVELIRKMVDPIRFEKDSSGYYFVYRETTNVSLPPAHDKQGKDLGQLKDKNGVRLVYELYQLAKGGGGFLEYVWPKPGAGDQPKLSYAEMIPGTEMWIGTGVYIDNISVREQAIADAISESVDSTTGMIALGVVVILLAVVLPLTIFIFLSIVRPLRSATTAAQQVAGNNLEVEVTPEGHDEVTLLEEALGTMIHTLRDNIANIEKNSALVQEKAEAAEHALEAAEVAKTKAEAARSEGLLDAAERLDRVLFSLVECSDNISGQTDQVNTGTRLQLSRISETATSIEEMNATVAEVARNASFAAERAEDSKGKANEGRSIVNKSVASMQELSSIASELGDNMGLLGEKADNIGQIISVINDIADQTNLLALNAAIEAARAGEAGRGFAVVADEVRKLAEKTMSATKEVGDAITGIQQVAKGAIENTEQAVESIAEASSLATDSDQMLTQIVDLSDETAAQVTSIATAAEQQSAASEEINRSVLDVNQIASDNAGSVEGIVKSTREMTKQVDLLKNLVASLKKEGGSNR